MLREAELFVMAEVMLVEVLGRIRDEHWDIAIPPLFDVPGADQEAPLRQLVEQYARDEASVPDVLAGRRSEASAVPDVPAARPAGASAGGADLGADAQATVTRLADAACVAARRVSDGEAVVHPVYGDASTSDYLVRTTIARAFLAHNVAMYLGSTACPLPEELARPLWEITAPEADRWRSLGIFRDPLPLPEHVSWRDRFLRCAGHDPHPVGH